MIYKILMYCSSKSFKNGCLVVIPSCRTWKAANQESAIDSFQFQGIRHQVVYTAILDLILIQLSLILHRWSKINWILQTYTAPVCRQCNPLTTDTKVSYKYHFFCLWRVVTQCFWFNIIKLRKNFLKIPCQNNLIICD